MSGVAGCVAFVLGVTLALFGPLGNGIATHEPTSGASAHAPVVSLRRIGHGGELEISRMPEPPVGEVYELWLDRPGSPPRPTDALFTVTRSGSATVDIPGSLRGLRSVLVTAEPLGGSAAPTSAPVLKLPIAG